MAQRRTQKSSADQGAIDKTAEYLIRAGVSPEKANRRPDDLPHFQLRRASQFKWEGADYRPDMFRYSMVFTDKDQRKLERAGFFFMGGDMDVRMCGIGEGRVMARPLLLDGRAMDARAKLDYQRRTAQNVRTGRVLDQESGARYEMTSNYSPATATEN